MGALVLLWLAWASASDTPAAYEAQWTPAPVVGDIQVADQAWSVFTAREDRDIWLVCPRGTPAPQRVGLVEHLGGITLIAGDVPEPVAVRRGWWLPRPGTLGSTWAIDQTACTPWVRRVTTSPDWLDVAAYQAQRPLELRDAVQRAHALAEPPEVAEALAVTDVPTWWAAFAAARPEGGFVTRRTTWHPADARSVNLTLDGQTQPWWLAQPGAADTVQGPAQLVLDVRATGGPGTICLTVQGTDTVSHCAETTPVTTLSVQDGTLQSQPATHEGQAIGRRARFSAYVPPGQHTVTLDRAALVRGRVLEIDGLRAVAPLPTRIGLLDTVDPPDPGPRIRAQALDRTLPSPLLFGPAPWRLLEEDDVSWVPAAVGDALLPDVDQRVQVLLDSAPGTRCTLTLGSQAWSTSAGPGIYTLQAPSSDAATLTALHGCTAWSSRAGGAGEDPDRRTAVPTTALQAGQIAAFAWPAPHDGQVTVRVYPALGVDRVDLDIQGAAGRPARWSLRPLTRADAVRDADGTPWGAPVDLTVYAPGPTLHIRATGDVAIRAVSHAADAPTAAPAPAAEDLSFRGISERIAQATDDATRRKALLLRGTLLAQAGDLRGARRDLELATGLGADVSVTPLARTLADDLREQWAPPSGWTSLTATLVPEPVDDALLDAAAAGDALHLAQASPLGQDVPWWLRAARNQVLDGPAALAAYRSLVDAGVPDVDHPGFGPIRAWSTWQGVPAIRQTQGFRAAWPADLPPSDAAWPEDWPAEGTLHLGGSWLARLPPSSTPSTLLARCRADDVAASGGPCTLRILDPQRRTTAEHALSPWGGSHRLDVPPHTDTRFVVMTARGHAALQLSTPGQALPQLQRDVRRMEGREARFEVLGPTVVRIGAWHPGQAVTVVAEAGPRSARADATPDVPGTLWLSIPTEGTVTVTVLATPGTLVDAEARVVDPRPLEPAAHAPLVHALYRQPDPPPRWPAVPPPEPERLPDPRLEAPRWTVVAEARVGIGGEVDIEPEAAATLPVRGLQRIGITSRPSVLPIWVDGAIGVMEAVGATTVTEARVGAEAWWQEAPLRGWVRGDAVVRVGLDADVLTALRADIEAGLSWRPRSWFDLRGGLIGGAASRFGGWSSSTSTAPDVLWSVYRETHPLWLRPELEARFAPTPWFRVRLWGAMVTNRPGEAIIMDAYQGGADVRVAAPGFRGLVGLQVQHRPEDIDRVSPYTAPSLYGSLRGTVWARHDVATALTARVDWQPRFERVSVDLGVQVLWGRRPGLPDLRPSRYEARYADTWQQPDRFEVGP